MALSHSHKCFPFLYLKESLIFKYVEDTEKLKTSCRLFECRFEFARVSFATGGDAVAAKMRDSNGVVTQIDIVDNGNGTYSGTFKPTVKGDHLVFLYIREKPIYGSPFEVTVTAGIEVDKTGPMLLKFGAHGVLGQSKGSDDNFEPWGIASDEAGSMIVSDHNNHQILVCSIWFILF